MKLRIRGNSVRIRVTRSELAAVAERGYAEDAVRFSPQTVLRYRLSASPEEQVAAEFSGDLIHVRVPQSAVRRWVEPSEVSIRGEQPLGDGETLRILVEKDFECLAPREGEDDSDLFVNPQKAARC
jgi:hypothetical protein